MLLQQTKPKKPVVMYECVCVVHDDKNERFR